MADLCLTSSPDAPQMTVEAFSAAFTGNAVPSGECALTFEGKAVLPVRVLSNTAPNKAVILAFHGAINQTIRKIPVYFGSYIADTYGDKATIISIADPSLRLLPDAVITWYAGDHELPVQPAIAALCKAIATHIAPERFIFAGGSSGAHAVLHHSHRIPGSTALVANPIIRMRHGNSVERYVKLCWPGRSADEIIGSKVADDILERYRDGYENTVVLLQNCTDQHFRYQALPLLQAIAAGRHIFLSEYFKDFIGHVYPPDPWLHWIGALLSARKDDVTDITAMAKRLSLDVKYVPPGAKAAAVTPARAPAGPDPAERKRQTDLADRVAQDLLEAN